MLEVIGVSWYGRSGPMIQDMTFQVQTGEVLGLLGLHDAETKTVLHLLAGRLTPTSGAIRLHGKAIHGGSQFAGYVPGAPLACQEMTVQDYVTLAAALRGVPHALQAERVHRSLAALHLLHVVGERVGALTPACQQRVGFAQALVHDPAVLLVEDPVMGFSTQEILAVGQIVRQLAQDRMVVIGLDSEMEGRLLCDRLMVVERGPMREPIAAEGWRIPVGRRPLIRKESPSADSALAD